VVAAAAAAAEKLNSEALQACAASLYRVIYQPATRLKKKERKYLENKATINERSENIAS